MRRNRRATDEFNISFLDVICCGFGAIVLLLMIAKTVEPIVLEKSAVNLDGQVADLQKQLFTIRGETHVFNRDLSARKEQLSLEAKRIAILKTQKETIEMQFASLSRATQADEQIKGKLEIALQTLTQEMQRLLGSGYQSQNDLIGGIPVDSEYIVFIIDTSGSMFDYAWDRVINELVSTLDIYPEVKGIQVMNDMGDYMFTNYRGKWIPDTKNRRGAIIKRLRSWNPFSNSSPVEGIQRAIRAFYDPDKKISLYVFGDDFRGHSIQQIVRTVDRLNKEREKGQRMVRIHAVGFPVQFTLPKHLQTTGIRFAALMRELTYKNGGTFVGLNDFKVN